MKKYKLCIDCNTRIDYRSKRCRSCSKKGIKKPQHSKRMKGKGNSNYKTGKYSDNKNRCIECKSEISIISKKRCMKCEYKQRKGIRPIGLWVKGTTIIEHHIDLNKKNNIKSNKLKLTVSKHTKLHQRAYEYLVRIGLIGKYIKWFSKKYSLQEIK